MADQAVVGRAHVGDALPSPIPGTGESALTVARQYVDAGLSVLPILRGQKSPATHLMPADDNGIGRWNQWQRRLPTHEEIISWFARDSGSGVGIIGGKISNNLLIYDVDNPEYSAWLERHERILQKFWTVRTGSGKLHLYCYSPHPLASSVVTEQGVHYADIRAEGEYVVAPPSQGPTGGVYETLYGDFTAIPTIPDSLAFFERVLENYLAQVSPVLSPAGREHPVGRVYSLLAQPAAPLPAMPLPVNGVLTAADREGILDALYARGLSERIRSAIEHGAKAGDDGWEQCPSDSEVDFLVSKALLRIGLTEDEGRQLFLDWPIGDHTFRNPTRKGSKGEPYFKTTWDNAVGDVAAEMPISREGMTASGDNFHVTKSVRSMTDPPTYWLMTDLHLPGVEPRDLQYTHKALLQENIFRDEMLRQCNLAPIFHKPTRGASDFYTSFSPTVIMMAELVDAPEEARGGYLKTLIKQVLTGRHLLDEAPAAFDAVSLGWKDKASGRAHFRGFRLVSLLGMHVKQPPTAAAVWEAVRGMSGAYRVISLSDATERLWSVPLKALE